jgi:hypothetical protein
LLISFWGFTGASSSGAAMERYISAGTITSSDEVIDDDWGHDEDKIHTSYSEALANWIDAECLDLTGKDILALPASVS